MVDEVVAEDGTVVFRRDRHAAARTDVFGRRRRWERVGRWERAFLLFSVLNICACIALSVYRLVVVVREGTHSSDFTFTILFIVNSVFCLFYVIHGLFKELRFEIYMFIAACGFVIVYCIVHYVVRQDYSPYKTIRLGAVCVLGPISIALAINVVNKFGWLEFEILGASEEMQGMFCQTSWFSSLIKFDLQVTVSFFVLLLDSDGVIQTADIIAMATCIPLSVVWVLIGRISVHKEWKVAVILFALVGLAVPGYAIFRVIRNFQTMSKYLDTDELLLAIAFPVTGALLILIRCIVYVELVLVYRNFGRGLRERAFDDEANERTGLLARD